MARQLATGPDDVGGTREGAPDDPVLHALRRLLADAAFAATDNRRRLLEFIVRETLAGRAERLKGSILAQDVFGRGDDFDPQVDAIVRLEALRLRRDLERYYAEHGDRSDVRISIPKGAYVAAFSRVAPCDPDAPAGPTAPAPPASASAPPEAVSAPAPSAPPKRWRRGFAWAALILVVAVAVSAVAVLRLWNAKPDAPAYAGEPGVGIVPFEPLSSRDEDRYLAQGVSDQLTHDLMTSGLLHVYALPPGLGPMSGDEMLALRASHGIDYVVMGRLRSSPRGGPMRLLVQLRRSTGEIVWSADYAQERTAGNLIAMQDELAASIADVLGQSYGVLARDLQTRSARTGTPSDGTYDCLLQARFYQRSMANAALREKTLACLENAVRRDPGEARAWAMLGWLRRDAGLFGHMAASERRARYLGALAASERAIALAPRDLLALQAHSSILHYLGRYDEAAEYIRKAWEISPRDPEILQQMGWRMAVRSEMRDGVEYVREAIRRSVDPPARYYNVLALEALMRADYGEMLAAARISSRSGYQMGNVLFAIANVRADEGDPAAARLAMTRVAERQPEFLEDPAEVLSRHGIAEPVIAAVLDGMKDAGWRPEMTQ